MNGTDNDIPGAWRNAATPLTEWTRAHLVNRTDVWGGYLPLEFRRRAPRADGTVYEQKSVTKPATDKRGTVSLSKPVLERHFAGRNVGDIVGLHSTSPDGTCRWGGIDIDAHAGGECDAEANERAAMAWHGALTEAGHVVLLTDSNGKGGYHLLIVFDRPLPSAQVHAFLGTVVGDFANHGLTAAPEVFPKQPALKTDKGFGNWLRLPGRHHTLPHWSLVWDGQTWLEGADAVDFILALKPGPADLVPDAPPPPPRPRPRPAPSSPRTGLRTDQQIALECLARLPGHIADNYETWVEVGMALHSVDAGPDMLDAWDGWSQVSGKYTSGECGAKWKTFASGGGVKIGTLINLARKNGFDVYARGGWGGKVGMNKQSQKSGSEAASSCEETSGQVPAGEPESPASPACAPGVDQLVLDSKNPVETARRFRDSLYAHPDAPTLHFSGDVFHRWIGSAYQQVGASALRAQLYAYTDTALKWVKTGDSESLEPFKPTRSSIDNIQDALRAIAHTEAVAPCWLSDDPSLPKAAKIIAARNGLLQLQPSGKPVLVRRPTPLFFGTNAIDFNYDPNAPQPREWLRFLDQIWADDQEALDLLAEWMGYVLTADTSQQKMLLVVGPPRSGKGTLARVLTKLIGEANVCGPTLSSLSTNFGMWPMLGKQLAIISDARLGGRADQSTITERLLAISGEDAITVDRKNMTSVTGRLPVRVMILTNEIPKLADSSGTLANRFLVLTLEESFLGREDTKLLDRIVPELPGILLWAIAGWRRLIERGRFVQPSTSADAIGEMKDLSSPVSAFVRECCNVAPGLAVPVPDIYDAFVAWSHKQGTKRPDESYVFGRNLRAAVTGIAGGQQRDGESRVRIYKGIDLTLVGKALADAARVSRNGQPGMVREELYA